MSMQALTRFIAILLCSIIAVIFADAAKKTLLGAESHYSVLERY